MKSTFICFYILLLFSCSLTQKNKSSSISLSNNFKLIDSSNIYRITQIDSIEDIYIILAQKKDTIYKIISIQDSLDCANKIKIGQCYNLILKSVFPEGFIQKDGVSFMRYGLIRIPLGGSKEDVWDLFSTENLKGLCLY